MFVCAIFKRLMKIFCPNSGIDGGAKGAMDSEFYIDFYADDSTAEGSFTTDGDGSEGGLIGSGPPSPAPGSPAPGSPAPGGANGRGSGALSEPMLAADPGVNRLVRTLMVTSHVLSMHHALWTVIDRNDPCPIPSTIASVNH